MSVLSKSARLSARFIISLVVSALKLKTSNYKYVLTDWLTLRKYVFFHRFFSKENGSIKNYEHSKSPLRHESVLQVDGEHAVDGFT